MEDSISIGLDQGNKHPSHTGIHKGVEPTGTSEFHQGGGGMNWLLSKERAKPTMVPTEDAICIIVCSSLCKTNRLYKQTEPQLFLWLRPLVLTEKDYVGEWHPVLRIIFTSAQKKILWKGKVAMGWENKWKNKERRKKGKQDDHWLCGYHSYTWACPQLGFQERILLSFFLKPKLPLVPKDSLVDSQWENILLEVLCPPSPEPLVAGGCRWRT